MPRKREAKSANFYAVFPERLREVMQEHGATQQELAEYVGKSRQAIGYYADGSSSPDWETLAKIAQYFGVSADWLLGLTDTHSTDVDIQSICKHTGLSECALNALCDVDEFSMQAVNQLFESRWFNSFVRDMSLFLAERNHTDTSQEPDEKDLELAKNLLKNTTHTIVSRHELSSVYIQDACESLKRILWNQISLKDI